MLEPPVGKFGSEGGEGKSPTPDCANQPKHDLDDDQRDDRGLEGDETAVARRPEQKLERFLNAFQLRLERAVPVGEVELGAQVAVDAVHCRIVPSRIRPVEQVQHRQDFAPCADRRADESV